MIAPFEHKGYVGTIDTFDADLDLMSGTVLGMRDVIHFEGQKRGRDSDVLRGGG